MPNIGPDGTLYLVFPALLAVRETTVARSGFGSLVAAAVSSAGTTLAQAPWPKAGADPQNTGSSAQPLIVGIDVRPHHKLNVIEAGDHEKIEVAILSSETFDAAALVAPSSIRFGRSGVEQSVVRCEPRGHDVNKDKLKDLVCSFRRDLAGFRAGDRMAILRAKTITGQDIVGADVISIEASHR